MKRKSQKPSRQPLTVGEITPNLEQKVCITVAELTAIYILIALRGFGPQKFKELHANRIMPVDIITGQATLPTAGKRGDDFRQQLGTVVTKEREICHQRAIRQIARAGDLGAKILTYANPLYPSNVFDSNNPVPVLYVLGASDVLKNQTSVACVGTRQIRQPYIDLHKSFAQEACKLGFSIVAGFALGADTLGHSVARDCGGQTICVMPCGLDRPFPPENKGLWQELLEYRGAALVSEFPFGTAASTLTLRKRNKLIVSFAKGVLVSQSAVKGGAMNAYRFALEQRKPIATFLDDKKPDTSGNKYITESHVKRRDKEKLTLIENKSEPFTTFSLTPDRKAYSQWLKALSSST